MKLYITINSILTAMIFFNIFVATIIFIKKKNIFLKNSLIAPFILSTKMVNGGKGYGMPQPINGKLIGF